MRLRSRYLRIFGLCVLLGPSTACVGYVWTGATLFYDRHNLFKKADDFKLSTSASYEIFKNSELRCERCVVDVTTFNADLLVSGHVPNQRLKNLLDSRLRTVHHYRHIYNEVIVAHLESDTWYDTWITSKVRSHILSDDSIDPNPFKIVTTDGVVYVMGEMEEHQARRLAHLIAEVPGVLKVVTLLKTYRYKS